MRKLETAVLAIVLLSFALSLYFYEQMPERIASHWNFRGEADAYSPKFWGLFIMPIISVFLAGLLFLIPRIDPMKANVEKFRSYFENFVLIITLFFFYLYSLTIAWNLGARFNLLALITPGFAVLFYYSGVLMEHAKMNWFIGIRTPWTMSSENVWNKTHKIGAKLFKACGAISLLGVFAGDYAIVFVIAPVLLASIYLFIYSYLEYEKEKKVNKKSPHPKRMA